MKISSMFHILRFPHNGEWEKGVHFGADFSRKTKDDSLGMGPLTMRLDGTAEKVTNMKLEHGNETAEDGRLRDV